MMQRLKSSTIAVLMVSWAHVVMSQPSLTYCSSVNNAGLYQARKSSSEHEILTVLTVHRSDIRIHVGGALH
jgi:hypothetical protein